VLYLDRSILKKLETRMIDMNKKELEEIDFEATSIMANLLAENENVQFFKECEKIIEMVKVLKNDRK